MGFRPTLSIINCKIVESVTSYRKFVTASETYHSRYGANNEDDSSDAGCQQCCSASSQTQGDEDVGRIVNN